MFDAVTAPLAVPTTDDERYDAMVAKAPGLRDAFVIAVKSTGVYCRPGCPARTPLRKNVSFYATCEAARDAGFRACLRCKPDEARPGTDVVERACRLIEAAETPPSLEALAGQVGVSPFHFHRLFKAQVGVTPAAYAAQVKDRRAKAALNGGASVTEAIYDGGYGAPSRFYDKSHARFGATPRQWRGKGAGLDIKATVAPCSLGWVLVAATDRGVCAIELGDAPELLRERFALRFPEARVVEDDAELAGHLSRILEIIDQPGRASTDLPLDVRGTAFQQRVWDALRRIPAGETWTYGQLAQAVGAPKAARAVGAACGANPVCVVVPCHRVVGSDGRLTGFAYGMERKRILLEREKA
ncbi:MAG TPA: bifunctional DNA-binding transcriptional regulator/O6-methylguanine-DNA methyltransferase Ada [Caulobacteraceae bacterium]|jgi:AraC family transcriptional regulator of adaptative response/methylated-DNA-[protein]-cysteine methyltransferase